MMHNGRLFKEGTPQEIEDDPEVQEIYLGGRPWLSAPPPRPTLKIDDLQVYYGESHAIQGVSLTLERGVLSVVGRNGMGKTHALQHHRRAEARALRLDPHRRPRDLRGSSRTRSTGSASAMCRRAGASGRAFGRRASAAGRRRRPRCGMDRRAHLPDLSAARRAARQWRLAAVRRRAADAGDRARAARQSQAAGHGRADRRPGADHRRPGRADAGHARRGRRDGDPGHRAEYRRCHRRLRPRRDHGQWPHQPHHGGARARRRPRAAAAAARRRPRMPTRPPALAPAEAAKRRAAVARGLSASSAAAGGAAGSAGRRHVSPGHRDCRTAGTCRSTAAARRRRSKRRSPQIEATARSSPFRSPSGSAAPCIVAGTFDTKGQRAALHRATG